MNVTRIALRNITRQKKRSILLGGAIAFGVMIITLIGSFTAGITNTASSNFTDMLGGQLYITGQELTDSGNQVSVIKDRDVLGEALQLIEAQITERTYRSRVFGEIIFGSKSTSVSIEGVDWADEPELVETLSVVSGEISVDMDPRGLVLPEYTAKDIDVQIGETVLVRTSTVTGQQNVAEFEVLAITEGDSMFSFSSAYADRPYLNSFIGLSKDDYQVLNIALEDPTASAKATSLLQDFLASLGRTEPETEEEGGLGGMRDQMQGMAALMGGGMFSSKVEAEDRWEGTRFAILNINDVMVSITSTVNVLNTVSYIIFIVLIIITMVGLLNTFRMVLIERTQEIGTMRAIGMQRGEVRNIFLSEALILALAGALAGLIIALVLSAILSIVPISSESPLQLFLVADSFAFPVVPSNIISTFFIISLATLGSAYFPARKAAKLDPAVALRTTY
ncbi:MAG: FtsX-like permease family protein [Spirochaetales bacterium]|jgi:putative ABC transport system permease protein|nr:FtsX-like permease family protein [Spirochaetales bacterium]